MVPGWTSLLLHYDLCRTDHLDLAARLTPLLERWLATPLSVQPGRLHEIPVWYAGADLPEVAAYDPERPFFLHKMPAPSFHYRLVHSMQHKKSGEIIR